MLSSRIQRQSIPFVISHTLGVAGIVFYSIPNRLADYAISLLSTLGFPLSPLFSALEAKEGMGAAREAWIETNRWQEILMTLLALGLGFLGASFIGLWIGPEYAEKGKWIIIILCLAMFVGGLAPNSSRLLVALGKHGRVALKLVGVSLIAILAAIAAAHRFGLPGIAAAVALGNIAGTYICWREACTCLEIPLGRYLRDPDGVAAASRRFHRDSSFIDHTHKTERLYGIGNTCNDSIHRIHCYGLVFHSS